MLSRVSRIFSRSRHRNDDYKIVPTTPQIELPPDSFERSFSTSSGHSSSCSVNLHHSPLFVQAVHNDTRPTYGIETALTCGPSSMLSGTSTVDSLSQSDPDENLRERMNAVAFENEKQPTIMKANPQAPPIGHNESTRHDKSDIRRWYSLHHSVDNSRKRQTFQQLVDDREREADQYTSTDLYCVPSIRRDNSFDGVKDTEYPRTPSSPTYTDYVGSMPYNYVSRESSYHSPHCSLPTHSGPYRGGPVPHYQESNNIEGLPTDHRRDSIAEYSCLSCPPSTRQGSSNYPQAPSYRSNFYDRRDLSRRIYDLNDIPATRISRLKQPPRTFPRDDTIKVPAKIGRSHTSGISASKVVSQRQALAKSDIEFASEAFSPMSASQEKQNTLFKQHMYSARLSPCTPPHVIKIGKHKGRYRTSKMPAHHLTVPDTDSDGEASTSCDKHLPPGELITSSTGLLDGFTASLERTNETDKWLEEVIKYTLPYVENTKNVQSFERKNTVDMKRHQVFSTSVDVQPREFRRAPSSSGGSETPKQVARECAGAQEVSSWIASEIFCIAKTHATEPAPPRANVEEKEEWASVESEMTTNNGYGDIESLMGDYFEDIKVTGSDCGKDF